MKSKSLLLLLFFGVTAAASAATIFYDNTTTSLTQGIFFVDGHFSALGDQIHLASTGTANEAVVQFVNRSGSGGTFDAQLDIYTFDSSNVLGTQLGSDFLVANNSISANGTTNVTFSLGSITVSQDLVFLVQQLNVTNTLDLGLSLYDPPSTGTSDNGTLVGVGAGRGGPPTAGYYDNTGYNVFFQLTGPDAPEPSTLILFGTGLIALSVIRFRRV